MNVFTKRTVFNTDTFTPIGIFLALRNHYSKIALLESNDYHDRTDSKSFIGMNPLAEIVVKNKVLSLIVGDETLKEIKITKETKLISEIQNCIEFFKFQDVEKQFNGFFGSVSFEFSLFIENQILKKESDLDFPDFQFFLFQYIIVLDHFKDNGILLENSFENSFSEENFPLQLIQKKNHTDLYFELVGEESSSLSDEDFRQFVVKAKNHCTHGDVFQLVLSRNFKQRYFGDDFEVYRSLRRLNPSPYLYYFDFETHRILGSSPEAQLKISDKIAEIHPIAGTVRKSFNLVEDLKAIEFLKNDAKENAEHTMLVDLARNDLSKSCTNVRVEKFKEIQHFSHVIHLVSKVSAKLNDSSSNLELFSDSFPAGTLSGTPKPKALELISTYELKTRDFYGGAIGHIGVDGSLNLAIIIRSILSKNNELHYRAGAGIVIHSNPESELQEVNNKLKAVKNAILQAETRISKADENNKR
ncbi:MAG: anthranilate synthase component I family protein [Bacteroidota bacterium]